MSANPQTPSSPAVDIPSSPAAPSSARFQKVAATHAKAMGVFEATVRAQFISCTDTLRMVTFAQALSEAQNCEVAMRAVVEHLSGRLYLLDVRKQVLWTRLEKGRRVNVPSSAGMLGSCVSSAMAVCNPDVTDEEHSLCGYNAGTDCAVDPDCKDSVRSFLCTPVKSPGGSVIGVIAVWSPQVGAFKLIEHEALFAVGTQISQCLLYYHSVRTARAETKVRNPSASVKQSLPSPVNESGSVVTQPATPATPTTPFTAMTTMPPTPTQTPTPNRVRNSTQPSAGANDVKRGGSDVPADMLFPPMPIAQNKQHVENACTDQEAVTTSRQLDFPAPEPAETRNNRNNGNSGSNGSNGDIGGVAPSATEQTTAIEHQKLNTDLDAEIAKRDVRERELQDKILSLEQQLWGTSAQASAQMAIQQKLQSDNKELQQLVATMSNELQRQQYVIETLRATIEAEAVARSNLTVGTDIELLATGIVWATCCDAMELIAENKGKDVPDGRSTVSRAVNENENVPRDTTVSYDTPTLADATEQGSTQTTDSQSLSRRQSVSFSPIAEFRSYSLNVGDESYGQTDNAQDDADIHLKVAWDCTSLHTKTNDGCNAETGYLAKIVSKYQEMRKSQFLEFSPDDIMFILAGQPLERYEALLTRIGKIVETISAPGGQVALLPTTLVLGADHIRHMENIEDALFDATQRVRARSIGYMCDSDGDDDTRATNGSKTAMVPAVDGAVDVPAVDAAVDAVDGAVDAVDDGDGNAHTKPTDAILAADKAPDAHRIVTA